MEMENVVVPEEAEEDVEIESRPTNVETGAAKDPNVEVDGDYITYHVNDKDEQEVSVEDALDRSETQDEAASGDLAREVAVVNEGTDYRAVVENDDNFNAAMWEDHDLEK